MDILGWDRASTGVAQPDLVATGLVLSGVSLTYHISNIGNGSATSSSSGVYLSTDATVTTSDTLLGTTAAGALAAGASDTETFTLSFPATLSPGTYYVAVLADYNNSVLESNEGNNASNTFPVIIGNGSGNSLNGTTSNDIMFGLAGDDVLDGGTGADSMYGGLGNDTYVIDSPGDVAVENFGEGTDLARSSVSYTLPANIENLTLLSASNINGTGNGLANVITGNAGDNVLSGAGGNDTLMGGLGADRFLFNSTLNGASNVDTVVDFSHAEGDIIGLDHTIFTALTAPQSSGAHSGFSTVQSPTIWASDFYASANGAAHLPTDHILYNTTTGVLAYDPDGNGAMPAIPFAVLPNLPNLVAADFWYL
jgi:Ca2+-binding RTX toxin-like protein